MVSWLLFDTFHHAGFTQYFFSIRQDCSLSNGKEIEYIGMFLSFLCLYWCVAYQWWYVSVLTLLPSLIIGSGGYLYRQWWHVSGNIPSTTVSDSGGYLYRQWWHVSGSIPSTTVIGSGGYLYRQWWHVSDSIPSTTVIGSGGYLYRQWWHVSGNIPSTTVIGSGGFLNRQWWQLSMLTLLSPLNIDPTNIFYYYYIFYIIYCRDFNSRFFWEADWQEEGPLLSIC